MKNEGRVKEISFTKRAYVGVGYPPMVKGQAQYVSAAEVVSSLYTDVVLVFKPQDEKLDSLLVYLTPADAYRLGKLLIDRAVVSSAEKFELELGDSGRG